MQDPQIIKAFVDYGFAIVGLVLTARFLAWLIKYILDRNKQREDLYINIIQGDIKSFGETLKHMNECISANFTIIQEALKYQRQEHSEMMKQLNEITLALGRINGYKDEYK